MTLRRKFLIRISLLTFVIIMAMSGTYYILFTHDVRERSHQNVEMTFNLIVEDLTTRIKVVSSKIDAFIEGSLAGPLYTIQLLKAEPGSDNQEDMLWSVKRRMTYLHILSIKMREFGTLIEASEMLIYGVHRNLLAAYTLTSGTAATMVYFADVWPNQVVPIQPADRWFATIQSLDEVPLQSLPQHIAFNYLGPIPTERELGITVDHAQMLLQFRVPIVERGDVQGVCVVNMAIRQQDVDRYARLTGNEINVFAGTSLSAGTLPEYNFFPDTKSVMRQSDVWLLQAGMPHTTFSDITVRKKSYYQGVLAFGTPETFTGAITVLFPRWLEEQQKRNFLMIVGLVTLGFSVLVVFEAFGLSGAIGKPVVHLMNAMQIVKSGNLDVEAPVETNDEIGRLAETFNLMTMQLKNSIARIEEQRHEMERKNQELERADKLKDEFLANTSHELRTPLNGIAGLAEAILSGADGPLTTDERRHVRMILQSSTRLTNLVSGLLDLSKVKSGQIQLHHTYFPLREVTEVVCAFSRELLHDKPVELRVDLPDDLPEVYADIDRVEQILTNLVGNASKFTKAGHIIISAERQNDWVCIAVADTGVGIPEEALERIFRPFEQADGSITREFGGTGLGLSITKELVELHGGHIRVHSQEGVGSTFFVTLPSTEQAASQVARADVVIEQSPQSSQPAGAMLRRRTGSGGEALHSLSEAKNEPEGEIPSKAGAPSGQGYTILVIDDDPTNIEVLHTQLTHAGFTVLTATNGQEAFEVINGFSIDVILCDVMMPVVDGYTFAMRIRERENLRDIPLVFVSAKDQKQDVKKGYDVGAVEYLIKPVVHEELLAKIHALIDLRQRARARYVPRDAIRTVDHLYDVEQEKDDSFAAIRSGNGETILAVDDEPINIEVLKAQLGRHNYQIITASSGPEALDKIATHHPHLVILDLMMPKMSGFRICQILRQEMQLRELPIIILTAKSNIYDKVYGLNIGANDYVIKPFHLDELLTRIRVLLDIANLQQELLGINENLRAEIIERTQAEEALRVEITKHQETSQQLADLNCALEQRVEERTVELRLSIESLKRTQQHLVQSEKMAALGSLVAGIAHEMNTPLGICITASSFLQQKTEDFQEWIQNSPLTRSMLDNYLETTYRTATMLLHNLQRAANLIQNFKQAAVDQSHLPHRAFMLKAQIQDSLLTLHGDLRNSSHRIQVTGDEVIEMNSIPGAVTQVITSLVMNSLNHAFRPGEAGEIHIDAARREEQAVISFSDNGCGIPKKHFHQIFNPFFTTSRSTGGTGLGLHVVYNLVTHKLKGTIACQSEEGIGTTFIITLPITLPDIEAPHAAG